MKWSAEELLRYGRTGRRLRPSQIGYRLLRRAQRRLGPPVPGEREVEWSGAWPTIAATIVEWGPEDPTRALGVARAVAAGRFEFMGQSVSAQPPESIDWERRHVSHLWSYHLHYFDYGVDLAWACRATGELEYPALFQRLVDAWRAGTRPGRGDGWDPYPTSLRTVNWLYAVAVFGDVLPPRWTDRLRSSLHRQLELLERRLELDLMGNHYLKNLKALAVGGLTLEGPGPERWRRRFVPRLWEEILEQVLEDGCHVERAPGYHAIAARDLWEVLDLAAGAGIAAPEAVRQRARDMARAYGVLCRPDGRIHRFQDTADGMAPDLEWLQALARRSVGVAIPEPAGPLALPRAGYFGFHEPATGERLLVDAGEPGPPYQPGHAHCGLLSFELDLAGSPLVVDSGVSGYDGDPLREYVRSTRAHNTVSVDRREQSEVWGTFRMARSARLRDATATAHGEPFRFDGACSPYYDGDLLHRRSIRRIRPGAWSVRDRVEKAAGRSVQTYLHLHPAWSVERGDGPGEFRARGSGGSVRIGLREIDRCEIVAGRSGPRPQGWYCPRFGERVASPTLVMEMEAYDGREFGYDIEIG